MIPIGKKRSPESGNLRPSRPIKIIEVKIMPNGTRRTERRLERVWWIALLIFLGTLFAMYHVIDLDP